MSNSIYVDHLVGSLVLGITLTLTAHLAINWAAPLLSPLSSLDKLSAFASAIALFLYGCGRVEGTFILDRTGARELPACAKSKLSSAFAQSLACVDLKLSSVY
jgi:hypothetical protein